MSQTGTLEIPPLPSERAGEYLDQLIDAWRQGMRQPLPVACRTAFAWLASGGAAEPEKAMREARKRYEGGFGMGRGGRLAGAGSGLSGLRPAARQR